MENIIRPYDLEFKLSPKQATSLISVFQLQQNEYQLSLKFKFKFLFSNKVAAYIQMFVTDDLKTGEHT